MTLLEEMQSDHDEIVADAGGLLKWGSLSYNAALSAVDNRLDVEMGGDQRRFFWSASVRIDQFADLNSTPKEGDQVKLVSSAAENEEKLGRVVSRSRDSIGAVMVFTIETREM